MVPDNDDADGNIELMARLASLYYLDNLTQGEIAERVGLSRIKVVRLLKKARTSGIVEIRIQTPTAMRTSLETALIKRFGLQQALLAADQTNEDNLRGLVAQMAASQLDRQLRDGDTVAIGMGRNVGAVPDALFRVAPRRCAFVTAIGGSPLVGQPVNSADICRRLAERFGGVSECLYAPAYVESPQVRESFLCHEEVRSVLESARGARIALVGIGDAMDDSAVVRMGCFSADDMTRMLVEAGIARKVCHPGAAARYEMESQRHHHLVCLRCEAIVDLQDPSLDTLPLPKRKAGFHIEDYSIQFRGLCPGCALKQKAKPSKGRRTS